MNRELDRWIDLISSEGWKQFIILLQEHKAKCQKDVNKGVDALSEEGRLDAMNARAEMRSMDRILMLVQIKIDNLKKGGK